MCLRLRRRHARREVQVSADQQAMDEVARAISDVFGPVFANTPQAEFQRLAHEDRLIFDADGRAVWVKEDEN